MIWNSYNVWDVTRFQVFRSIRFRLAIGCAAVLTGTALVAFAVIYWQITGYELVRADQVLLEEAVLLAARQSADLQNGIPFPNGGDLQVAVGMAGLFNREHQYLAGRIYIWPDGLKADGLVHLFAQSPLGQNMRVIARTLSGGETLVIARRVRDLKKLRAIVLHALEVCALAAVILSLLVGGWLSSRALRRVEVLNRAIERIMSGGLHERLPISAVHDEIDRLAGSVNRMLDRIEDLIGELKAVGDGIAHDLRAPLTRVRNYLEQGQGQPHSDAVPRLFVSRAIMELDQSLNVIGALLRMGEIENGRRRAAFCIVDLTDVAANIFDAYEPVAEEKKITLQFKSDQCGLASDTNEKHVRGDRDLLIEAAGNLIENAIKYTPEGGNVILDVGADHGRPFLRVIDDGPGITKDEREAVLGRFFRSEKNRHIPGTGLGLSLVAAIARLHDANVLVEDGGPGSVFTITFPDLGLV